MAWLANTPNSYNFDSAHIQLSDRSHVQGRADHSGDNSPVMVVRNGYKSYNRGKIPVLENFSMTVMRGTIYTLLGSSGCGKTTTLNSIAGVTNLNRGNIFVFGSRPGVAGKKLGYMPQEIGLYDDFSIAETLNYFGTLCGMDRDSVGSQILFLTKLLQLPPAGRRVGTLSGGQKRRISFSVALIHQPELLLLDEPTSGVDPLLRESIWKYLVSLTQTRNTSIIITTHYLNEAKPSDTIGIMRSGHLIAEDSPILLLEKYNTTSLEDVVLNLCKEEIILPIASSQYSVNTEETESMAQQARGSFRRVKALVGKNLVIMLRNLFLLIFVTWVPALIILLTCVGFENDPKGLKLGIVNHETEMSNCFSGNHVEGECDVSHLSCQFLERIPSSVLNLVSYESASAAREGVEAGETFGYVSFPQNFSDYFYERATSGSNVDEATFNKSEIIVKLDQSSRIEYGKISKTLFDAFENYSKALLHNCGFDERQAAIGLKYEDPLFGNSGMASLAYVAPSLSIGWLIFFPMISTSIRYIGEKKAGTFERTRTSGANVWEILLAYSITEFPVLVAQSTLVYLILNLIFQIDNLGSPALILIVSIMTGACGMSFGFLLGTALNEEVEAALLSIAIFFPNSFVSGMLWPAEGMPLVLQYIYTYLPCSLNCETLRSLYNRGWEFTHPNVWPGFLSVFLYTSLFIALTIILQKIKTN